MTREEQIELASYNFTGEYHNTEFLEGAKWADEHPDLYSVTRKAAEREREYMIDKICEFMQSCEGYIVSGEKCNYNNFMKFLEEKQ